MVPLLRKWESGADNRRGLTQLLAHVQAGNAHHGGTDVYPGIGVAIVTEGWEDIQRGTLSISLLVYLRSGCWWSHWLLWMLQLAAAIAFTVLLRRDGYLTPDLYIPFLNIEIVGIPWIVYMVFAAFVMVGYRQRGEPHRRMDGLATGVTIPVMLFYVAVSAWYGRSDLITSAAAMAREGCPPS